MLNEGPELADLMVGGRILATRVPRRLQSTAKPCLERLAWFIKSLARAFRMVDVDVQLLMRDSLCVCVFTIEAHQSKIVEPKLKHNH